MAKTAKMLPFPLSAFPTAIRPFIKEAAETLDCPRSYIALPLLAALASAIGNKRVIRLKAKSWEEPAVIWGAIIGDSGGLKTPAQSLAIGYLTNAQKEARKLGDDKIYIARDATFAGLRNALSQGDGSLLVTPDELITMLASFGKGGQSATTKGHWLSCWSGTSIDILRGNTKVPIHIPNPTVSVVGGIQPTTFRDSILKEKSFDDGLCARFLLTYREQRKPSLYTSQEVSDAAIDKRDRIFQTLFTLSPDPTTDAPIPIELSLGALKAWFKFNNSYKAVAHRSSPELRAAYHKLVSYGARIALIFQLVVWASKPNRKPDAQGVKISMQSMLGAIKLIEWFKQETKKVYTLLNESPEDRKRRELVELITKNGDTMTARVLTRHSSHYKTEAKATAALNDLAKEGYGKWQTDVPGKKGGRPATRLILKK